MAQSLGELGFDQARFGVPRPAGSYVMGLAEVLPLLIRIADKPSIRASDLGESLL